MPEKTIDFKIRTDASGTIRAIKDTHNALSSLETRTASLSSKLTSSWVRMAAAFSIPVSIGGLASLVKTTLEAKDRLSETAQKAGIAATSLQLYEYSAKLAGVSNDSLVNGIGILSKNMMGAADDIGGSVKAFNALGLSTKDVSGNLKSAETMIGEIADKFSVMRDSTGKTAMAMALFGKSGKEMIPFLNQGSQGLEEIRQRMIELGYSFDENAINRAAEVNDRFDELGMSIKRIGSRIVMNLLPELDSMSQRMSDLVKDTGGFKDLVEVSVTGLKLMATAAIGVAAAFDLMGTSIGEAAARYMKSYEESGLISRITGFAAAKAGYSALLGGLTGPSSLNAKLAGYSNLIGGLWSQSDKPWSSDLSKRTGSAPIISDAKDGSKAFEELAQAQRQWQKTIEAMNPYLDEEEKKLQAINDQAEALRERFSGKGMDISWIDEGLEWAQAYIETASAIKAEEEAIRYNIERSENIRKIREENLKDELDLKTRLLDIEAQRNSMNLEYDRAALDYQSKYGQISNLEYAQKSFDLDVRRLENMRSQLSTQIQIRSEAATEEDQGSGILELLLKRQVVEEEINRILGLRSSILKEHTGTYGEGFGVGWTKYFDSIGSEFQRGETYARDTAQAMHQAFEDLFFDPMAMNWDNLWKSMQRVAAKAMSDIAMNAMRTLGKSAFDYFLGGGGQNYALGNTVDLFSFHKGGIAGEVPRLHKGLLPSEFPAILQKGEGVFTPGQMKALGGKQVVVNIINNGGAEVTTQSRESSSGIELDVLIDRAVASKLGQSGSSSNKVMRQNFNISQRLIGR